MKTSISPRPLSSGAVAPSRSSRMVDAGRGGLTASVDISIYSRDKLPMVRDGASAPPHHEGPHPEERSLGRVSKDEKYGLSWFETREDALLTMRNLSLRRAGLWLQIGALVDPRHPRQQIIHFGLRSG